MPVNDDLGLPLQDLAIFAAVAEAEGFSAAARRLGVSKALVSTAVARLEDRLGVQLLRRTSRTLSLTEAGAAALPHAQRVLSAARDAEEAATAGRAAPRGTLRINAPMSFGLLHVMPAVVAYRREYPGVKVDVVLDDRVLDLTEGGFDLAIRIADLPDSQLIAHRLGTARHAIVASPAYLARAGTPAAPEELAAHDALVYSLSATATRWTLRRDDAEEVVRVKGSLVANSSLALQQAALAGLGLCRIPLFVVGDDLAAGRLVHVLPAWSLPEHGIWALTTSRELPAKTRAFVELFRARMSDRPA